MNHYEAQNSPPLGEIYSEMQKMVPSPLFFEPSTPLLIANNDVLTYQNAMDSECYSNGQDLCHTSETRKDQQFDDVPPNFSLFQNALYQRNDDDNIKAVQFPGPLPKSLQALASTHDTVGLQTSFAKDMHVHTLQHQFSSPNKLVPSQQIQQLPKNQQHRDYTPSSLETSVTPASCAPHISKTRRIKACNVCHLGKTQCDGKVPCSRCIRLGREAICAQRPANTQRRKLQRRQNPATLQMLAPQQSWNFAPSMMPFSMSVQSSLGASLAMMNPGNRTISQMLLEVMLAEPLQQKLQEYRYLAKPNPLAVVFVLSVISHALDVEDYEQVVNHLRQLPTSSAALQYIAAIGCNLYFHWYKPAQNLPEDPIFAATPCMTIVREMRVMSSAVDTPQAGSPSYCGLRSVASDSNLSSMSSDASGTFEGNDASSSPLSALGIDRIPLGCTMMTGIRAMVKAEESDSLVDQNPNKFDFDCVVSINDHFTAVTGYSSSEIATMFCEHGFRTVYDLLRPDQVTRVFSRHAKASLDTAKDLSVHTILQTKEGKHIPCVLSARYILKSGDSVKQTVTYRWVCYAPDD